MPGRGQLTSPEVQEIIVRLSKFHDTFTISAYTGVSVRCIRRILRYYFENGRLQTSKPRDGRKRKLRDIDANVSVSFLLNINYLLYSQYMLETVLRNTPDVYLDEIQQMILYNCGQEVSKSTIWRTLERAGFTLKKVSRVTY